MPYKLFVGIDWATEAHQVCLLAPDRTVVKEFSVQHTGAAIAALCNRLDKVVDADPGDVAIAIEVPRGALVETLVERGFHVYTLNPKQLDRFRDRHTVAGAKDDRRDAFVLADSLRTDGPLYRRVELDAPAIIELREFNRIDEDLRQEMNRLTNRLREQVHRIHPDLLSLCPAADAPWFWALLDIAPTPQLARRLRPARVRSLLRDHRIRRVTPEQVLAALRSTPPSVAPGVTDAAAAHIAFTLPRLRTIRNQRSDCARRIQAILDALDAPQPDGNIDEHRDVQIIRSLPGVGRVTAATMLTEASQPLARRDYHALRAHCGVAPVTYQTGKNKRRPRVSMRHACNARLRYAIYHWSRVASQCDPATKAHYRRLRRAGHSHGRALRGVADRLLRILIAMLRSRTLYDPSRAPTRPAPGATLVAA